MNLIEEIKSLGLEVPEEFHTMDKESLLMCMGGCGPGASGDRWVPDTLWGVNVKPACGVHDLDYTLGKDKFKADLRFLCNMIRIIFKKSKNKFMITLRTLRAAKYFIAVALGGDSSFKAKVKTEI